MEGKFAMNNLNLIRCGLLAASGIVLMGLAGMTFWTWTKGKADRPAFQSQTQETLLEGLKLYGQVPDFSLTERSGRRIELADLKGKVWIADFIYTNCPDTCPLQSAQMAELQKDLSGEKEVQLVSISVDPARDTPEALSEYAQRFGADPERWFFLTGEKEVIYRLAWEGFHLAAIEIPPEARDHTGASHMHSARFMLMDRQGQIRGYYDSNRDPEALQRLLRDVKALLQEKS